MLMSKQRFNLVATETILMKSLIQTLRHRPHVSGNLWKRQFFFYEYGLRPHVSSVFSGRIRKFLKTLSRVEIFLSDTNTYTCGRSYPEICQYAYVIPWIQSSRRALNKHGVQQRCVFFVNYSDF